MSTESGSWEAYYPDGIGCSNHQTTARSWVGQTAAELGFYMQKRGVTEASVFRLLVASFSTESVQQAATARLDRNGKVVNKRQQAMQSEIAATDNYDWIDNRAGLCKSELVDMLGVEEKISVIDPTSMAVFNFKKYRPNDDLTVVG